METKEIKTPNALQHRLNIEKLVTEISALFINMDINTFDECVNDTLEKIGRFADADRCYLFLMHANGKKMNNTHEWHASHIEPQIHLFQKLDSNAFPHIMASFKSLKPFHAPAVPSSPPWAKFITSDRNGQGAHSLIVVPLAYENTLIGFLGFDFYRKEQAWPQEDINLLQMVANPHMCFAKKTQ